MYTCRTSTDTKFQTRSHPYNNFPPHVVMLQTRIHIPPSFHVFSISSIPLYQSPKVNVNTCGKCDPKNTNQTTNYVQVSIPMHKKKSKRSGVFCKAISNSGNTCVLLGRSRLLATHPTRIGMVKSKFKFRPFSGKWDFRDGFFKSKPNRYNTAARKFFEETNISKSIVDIGKQRIPDFYVDRSPFWIFKMDLFDPSSLKPTHNIDQFAFVDIDELKTCARSGLNTVKTISGLQIEVSQRTLAMALQCKN